ncbi:uncharacterized protein LOC132757243 [Ruditapes philippinarum]|uniref:uncharacterized protein LOC132757243 n=1 Tax=Ruditapes philippinarum TaxID=129788 RepID=UPI00295C1E87|nr:uncharacterized protein LOC132757243 [Ruditapes philippinarum]
MMPWLRRMKKKDGLVLDSSQIEVLNNSYRCKEPNFLSAFSEENFDLFPVDSESEKWLQVPPLDSLVECCLTKRFGNRASFVKSKGRTLFTQPCKMVEKIAYKGQQAARLGLIIQMYIQQSLGNFLQFLESDDFNKEKATQHVKDVFAMSTKALDQLGRSGAFHHVIRRSVAMTDTALFEQPDNLEFSNLPLTGEGVFGAGLESLLKARKEKKKQIDDLIPDVKRSGFKRKFSGAQPDSSKRPTPDRFFDRPSASTSKWDNFRIPRLSRDKTDSRPQSSYKSRGSFGSYPRRSTSFPGRGKLAKSDGK